ncbi:MAG: bifunctional nuclease family protein [Chitinispirillales bacterium]|jgi:bifunctional DNase/RNase|nr:bifunctional nuclease family protein [Chitinispirillales bacterium]
MLLPVELSSFAIDPRTGLPLVVLREVGGERSVAVPIEPDDAKAIAMHTLQIRADKPGALDLVGIVIEQLGGTLYRTVITDVEESVFSASVIISAPGAFKLIDCVSSDAIILAMKCGAPILVKDTVFFKLGPGKGLSEEEQLKASLRSVDAVEFGNYVLE